MNAQICHCDSCQSAECADTSARLLNHIREHQHLGAFNSNPYKKHTGNALVIFYNHNNQIEQDISCLYGKKCFIMHVNKYHNRYDGCALQRITGRMCHFICLKCGGSLMPTPAYISHSKMHKGKTTVPKHDDYSSILDKMQKEIDELKLQISAAATI